MGTLRKLVSSHKKLLVAIGMTLLSSVLVWANQAKFIEFGFPLLWLRLYHLGREAPVADCLAMGRYSIRLDYLLINILLFYLAIRVGRSLHKKVVEKRSR